MSVAVAPRNIIGLNSQRTNVPGAIDFRRHERRKTRLCEVPHALTAQLDSISILQLRRKGLGLRTIAVLSPCARDRHGLADGLSQALGQEPRATIAHPDIACALRQRTRIANRFSSVIISKASPYKTSGFDAMTPCIGHLTLIGFFALHDLAVLYMHEYNEFKSDE